MADTEQLEILSTGVGDWNQWRARNPDVTVDLREADLRDAELPGADLRNALLSSCDFRDAVLDGADLSSAIMHSANLKGAHLRGAALIGVDAQSAMWTGIEEEFAWPKANTLASRRPAKPVRSTVSARSTRQPATWICGTGCS